MVRLRRRDAGRWRRVSWVVSDALDARWLHWEVGFVATIIGLAGLPIALGMAILNYRLHDIDIIISLRFVYGSLTAVLAGVFEVRVVTFQHALLALARGGLPGSPTSPPH